MNDSGMSAHRHNLVETIVVDDLWSELGIRRPVPPMNPSPTRPLHMARPLKVWWGAAALTLALHALVGGALMNFGVRAKHSQVFAYPSATKGAAQEIVTTLLLVPESQSVPEISQPSFEKTEKMTGPAVVARIPVISTPHIEVDTADDLESARAIQQDRGTRTPQKIYLGQIKARIERALSDVPDARFGVGKCGVKILQSESGDVREVEFQHCFAAAIWKEGLERAIRQASPLPAPPEASVFSDEVMVEF